METLPKDISETIEQAFFSPADKEKVRAKLLSLWSANLNVGPEQPARCILFVAHGKLEIVDEIFETTFHGDPAGYHHACHRAIRK